MRRIDLLLALLLTLLLAAVGCRGSMIINNQGSGGGDDDDSAAGDDDDATDDDDAVDDDDDVVAIDPVDCGPLPDVDDDATGFTYTGYAEVYPENNEWVWSGCEVLRRYADGELVCESLWDIYGPMMNWDQWDSVGRFRLDFTPEEIDHACGDEEWSQWRYRADFDWDTSSVTIEWANPNGQPQWEYWAAGTVYAATESYLEFDFQTPWWDDE